MPENAKPEAIPESWIESPNVKERSLWFKGEDRTYPRIFIEVNGVLLTVDGAKEMRDELNEVLE